MGLPEGVAAAYEGHRLPVIHVHSGERVPVGQDSADDDDEFDDDDVEDGPHPATNLTAKGHSSGGDDSESVSAPRPPGRKDTTV